MKHHCVPFFLDFLVENYWQSFALNSLSTWYGDDLMIIVMIMMLIVIVAGVMMSVDNNVYYIYRLSFDDTNKVSALLIQTPHLIKLIGMYDCIIAVLLILANI